MDIVFGLDHLWNAFQGIGAIVVSAAAVAGFCIAVNQVEALKATRKDAADIARAERTTELLSEFGSDDMEYRFGFFDAAYNVVDSREVFNDIFDSFVVSSRRKFRAMDRAERLAAMRKESIEYIDSDLQAESGSSKINKRDRASVCKNEIIAVANLCERTWALMEKAVIDGDLLLADQAYNIASTYFIAQDALGDLCREEHFNFDDFREIAIRARDYLRDKPYGADLVKQDFPPLPDYNPTP